MNQIKFHPWLRQIKNNKIELLQGALIKTKIAKKKEQRIASLVKEREFYKKAKLQFRNYARKPVY